MSEVLSTLQNVTGWLSDGEARWLNHWAAQVEAPDVIVEIGSFQGKSTIALALHASVAVYAIDPHEAHTDEIGGVFGPADSAAFLTNIVQAGVQDRVRPIALRSDQAYSLWDERIGLLFIDGAHNYAQVSHDVWCWYNHVARGGWIVLHDRTWPDIDRVLTCMDNETQRFRKFAVCDSIQAYEVVG